MAWNIEMLSLYRRLLRLHRTLPKEMRDFGIGYVRDEFKRQRKAGNEYMEVFKTEWMGFAQSLEEQHKTPLETDVSNGGPSVGTVLSKEKLNVFTDEQIVQLFELKKEASKPHNS